MSSGLMLKTRLSTSKHGLFTEGQPRKRAVQSLSWESYVRDELSVIDENENPPLLPMRPQLQAISLQDLRAVSAADTDTGADRNTVEGNADDAAPVPAAERRPSAKTHMASFVQRYRARLPRGIAKRAIAKELMRRRFSQLPPEPLPLLPSSSRSAHRTRAMSESRLGSPFDLDSISLLDNSAKPLPSRDDPKAITSTTTSNIGIYAATRTKAPRNDGDWSDSERANDKAEESGPDSRSTSKKNYLQEVSDNLQHVMEAFERRSRERAELVNNSKKKGLIGVSPLSKAPGPSTKVATKMNPPTTFMNASISVGSSSTEVAQLAGATTLISGSSLKTINNNNNNLTLTRGQQRQKTRRNGTFLAPDQNTLTLSLLRDLSDDKISGTQAANCWRHSLSFEPSRQMRGTGAGDVSVASDPRHLREPMPQMHEYEKRLVDGLPMQYVRPLLNKSPRASVVNVNESPSRVRICSRLADLINGRCNPGGSGYTGQPVTGPEPPPLVTGRAIGSARGRLAGGGAIGKRGGSPSLPPATSTSHTGPGASGGGGGGRRANLKQRDEELLHWLLTSPE